MKMMVGHSVLTVRNKIVLVQIGRKFYTLSKHVELTGKTEQVGKELKELLECKDYSIKLLREEQ